MKYGFATKFLSWVTVALFCVVVIVNYIATSETIGAVAFTNSQVADTHPVYGLPNGWAFAIWGIIFIFLGLYSLYQVLPAKCYGGLECEHVAKVRVPALMMMALNSVWNFLFGWEFYWVALLNIVLYDALLFMCLTRLSINYVTAIPGMTRGQSMRTKVFLVAPFSIHAGWVTVATALNVQVNALESGWMPSPDFSVFACWTAVSVGISLTVFRHADLPYTLVTLWALGGIVSNQAEGSTWGCSSRICGSCVEVTMPICHRANSAGADRLPNGWAHLDCPAWSGPTSTDSGTGASNRANNLDCVEQVVPKSSAVIWWSLGGMLTVICVYAAAVVMAACFPEQQYTTMPHSEHAAKKHVVDDVEASPDTATAMGTKNAL